MTVRRPHIRPPCETESSFLRRKNGLSSGVVHKWTGHHSGSLLEPLLAGLDFGFGFGMQVLRQRQGVCTTNTWKILSSALASFLYCSGSLDRASIQFRTGTMRGIETNAESAQLPKQVWQSLV